MTKHIAVLMGGLSSERPVSLASGEACARALEEEGYRVSRVDVQTDIAHILMELKPDVAFNALHGRFGEDGCIQGILEFLRIPYTHSGVLASALAMNKNKAKVIMEKAGIPVAQGIVATRKEVASKHLIKPPYVIKPVCEGSSFGVIIIHSENDNQIARLLDTEWQFGDEVLVERFIAGRELTCGVMGDRVLGVIDIVNEVGEFYDYDAKYSKGGSRHILPAQIPDETYKKIQDLALKAHKTLGCRGVSRTDFRYDDRPNGTGELVVLEVNTQPGMTETSLIPDMALAEGMTFGKLTRWIVEEAGIDR